MKTVIFDLDGTIVDNQDILLTAFRKVYAKVGEKYPGDTYILNLFGKDLKTILETLSFNLEKLEQFREEFMNVLKTETHPQVVPGMLEVLQFLKQNEFEIGLVTSKSRNLVEQELQNLDLKSFFSVVIDESSTIKHKPNPEPLLKACEFFGVKPSPSIPYVGDSRFDMLAACKANLLPVGVAWGVHGQKVIDGFFESCPEPILIRSPLDLKQFFEKLL